MPVETFNSNSLPMTIAGVSGQLPPPPSVISIGGGVSKGNPVEGVSAPVQIMGLVPVFPCTNQDCRSYGADYVTDDTQYTLPVFADPNYGETNTYHNDFNSWWFQYPGTYNAVTSGDFQLQHYVNGAWSTIATLNSTTYGVAYANNFQPNGIGVCTGSNIYGYKISWKKVYNVFGIGTYRFYVSGQYTGAYPYCYASPPFCLQVWTCTAVDETVKFEAQYKGGNVGSITTQGRSWNLCCKAHQFPSQPYTYYPINWYDSIRFYGMFTNTDYDKEVDSVKYQPGVIFKVRDEVIKKFKLFIGGGGSTKNAPLWLLERFVGYAMSADQLFVSDYNVNNPNYNLKKFWVVSDVGIKPLYKGYSRYMKVIDTEFREGQQYIFRDRCC